MSANVRTKLRAVGTTVGKAFIEAGQLIYGSLVVIGDIFVALAR